MSIYGAKSVPVKWEVVMDIDVDAIQEGREKLSRDLLSHICQAQVTSDQPESTDSMHVLHLWRLTQLLLETSVFESARYAQKLHDSDARQAQLAQEWERQKKAMLDEMDQLKKENQFLKGEKPGIMPCAGPAPTPAAVPTSTSSSSSDEVKSLQDKVRKLQEQYTTMMKQKTAIQDELLKLKESPAVKNAVSGSDSEDAVEELRKEVKNLKASLDGKLSDSTPFRNLKAMLAHKNTQLKELRRRLQAYEPAEAAAGDDETAELK